ncbi:UbiA prenyltransferase family protein [[Eubacterium] cellulosolvens]
MVKIFAKDSYKKAKFAPKMRAVLDLFRPFTLLAPLIGGTAAALMGLGIDPLPRYENLFIVGKSIVGPTFSWSYPFIFWRFPLLELITGVSALILVNAGSNVLNQVYDLKIDKINKPYRPIPSKIITKNEARTIAWVIYLVALWRAATVSSGAFVFLILIIMLITIFYSIPPVQLKKRLFISNISIAFARGMLGFVAGWSIFGDPFNNTPWLIGLIMSIYLIGAVTTKDFTDMAGDKKYGMRTLPVVFGKQKAIALSAPFFVSPFILIPIGIWRGHFIESSMILVTLIIWGAYIVMLLYKYGDTPDKKFENTPVWIHMYLMLMAIQIGFCLVYLNYALA